tara:strand:+ start:646 stop:1443 length:798 start_codon:yes stop_codon:yes gene_type:complete
MKHSGNLKKMKAELSDPISYTLQLGDDAISMNNFIGKSIHLHFTGQINCVACGRLTKKAFGQGFCYPCFRDSPMNSECIIRPELCEGHLGKGRDPQWELEHHVQPHVVYLALTSGVKVGVTRSTQVPTRWIDQGAWKAIKLAETDNRHEAGLIEVALKDYITDKTPWQRMLKNEVDASEDLLERKEELGDYIPDPLQDFYSDDDTIYEMHYPVNEYPTKVKSLNLDKDPTIEKTLNGIRGQYLIFNDNTVINLRKYSGYFIELED